MATIHSFQDLECWKISRELTKKIYSLFGENRDFGFRDQIQRASVSIMNNIAEGFGRNTAKEKMQFINFSIGSVYEVQSMLFLATDLGYISEEVFQYVYNTSQQCLETTRGFKRYLATWK